jgi:CheY-like chemotaxis protein
MRVLLIEDNADTADSLATVLRLAGHEVAIARDGPAGLSSAQTQWPHVVLLDLGLPGSLDGYQVAAQLRQQRDKRRPVIIAVTGYNEPAQRKRSYETGIDYHFTKPADPALLTELLERVQQLTGNR